MNTHTEDWTKFCRRAVIGTFVISRLFLDTDRKSQQRGLDQILPGKLLPKIWSNPFLCSWPVVSVLVHVCVYVCVYICVYVSVWLCVCSLCVTLCMSCVCA